MKEKIFGIGLNKTGTTTLGMALELLGYQNHVSNRLDLLRAYQKGEYDKVFKFTDKNNNFEDWPWPLMYKVLLEKYPEAKFILTIRKTESIWFKSLCKHSERTGPTRMRKIVYGKYMPQKYRNKHLQFYKEHTESVRSFFNEMAPDRLLVICWENGDGWAKLCSFLNKDMPNKDIPVTNSAEQDSSRRGRDITSFFKRITAHLFIKLGL